MSQENKDKADAAEDRTKKTRGFMQQGCPAPNSGTTC